uniref:Uncharacterized protein n=1 Tax=viral metagenome TaxID=1070528 RepID=A0A6M3MBD0_9ZZZZ
MREGGSVIIFDIEDLWGNTNTLGLGEHAVRMHAPPLLHDKRGNIIKWVNFESPSLSYQFDPKGSATASRTSDYSFSGDFSAKLYSAADGDAEASRVLLPLNDFHEKLVGIQAMFSMGDTNGAIIIALNYWETTTSKYSAYIRYSYALNVLQLWDETETWISLATIEKTASLYNFSTIKVIANLETKYFSEAFCFGEHFDLSSYAMHHKTMPASEKKLSGDVMVYGSHGKTTVYIDNIIMTELSV